MLRHRRGAAALLTAALAMSATASAVSATPHKPKRTQVTCTLRAYSVTYPATSGVSYGDLKCSRPLGTGVQRAAYTLGISPSELTSTGTFINYGAGGSTSGSSSLKGSLDASGTATLIGTLKITAGTGAYRHARGTGKLTCSTSDLGKTYRCTIQATLTGI